MGLPQNALEDDIYAFALNKDKVLLFCNQCIAEVADLKKCSACRSVSYCSHECQKSDWKLHKLECKAIQAHGEVCDVSVRLALRILARYGKNDFGEVTENYISGGSRNFLSLLDHGDKPDPEETELFVRSFVNYALAPHPDLNTLRMIYRKISINSFGVSNSFGYGIGVAMCIKLSAVNHSCKPLTRVCFRKRIAILAPVGDRMPATLEGACHSYIDELMPKFMRQSLLKKKYHFDCECEGCMDDERNALMEAYSCGNCVLGWVRNTEDARCGACGWQITRDHYELCRTAEESAIAAKPKLYNTTIASATRKHLGERLLELFENTLHDSNVHRMPVLRSLFETSLEEQDLQGAVKVGVAMVKLMSRYQSDKDLGLLYAKFQLCQLFCAMKAYTDATRLLQEIKGPFEKIYEKDSKILVVIYTLIQNSQSQS